MASLITPTGNAQSPRSLAGLASGLANIGGGQPDVDALMSQYASAQNNDPEALVRALRKPRLGAAACAARHAPGQFCAQLRRPWRPRSGRGPHCCVL